MSSRRSTKSHELTFEDRSRGGKARAEKIRLRKLAAEDLRIQMLAEGLAPRRLGRDEAGTSTGSRDLVPGAIPSGKARRPKP